MRLWLKFLLISSFTLNFVFILNLLLATTLARKDYYNSLENTIGVWMLSHENVSSMIRYSIHKDPEMMEHLLKIRENRHLVIDELKRASFNRKEAESLFGQIRLNTIIVQQKLHKTVIDYIETLPPEERNKTVDYFLIDNRNETKDLNEKIDPPPLLDKLKNIEQDNNNN